MSYDLMTGPDPATHRRLMDRFFPGAEEETKNICGKTRPESDPYAAFYSGEMGWLWIVRKFYQSPARQRENTRTRVFCSVYSPMTAPGCDMGDVYLYDIMSTPGIHRLNLDLDDLEFLIERTKGR